MPENNELVIDCNNRWHLRDRTVYVDTPTLREITVLKRY